MYPDDVFCLSLRLQILPFPNASSQFLSFPTANSSRNIAIFISSSRYISEMAYNVPSVSEVPRRWILAKVHSTEARYALLYEVHIPPRSCFRLNSFPYISLLLLITQIHELFAQLIPDFTHHLHGIKFLLTPHKLSPPMDFLFLIKDSHI